jgi:hypothetical protein
MMAFLRVFLIGSGALAYAMLVMATRHAVGDDTQPDFGIQRPDMAESISIVAQTTTWRARGRVSFPLVPALRNKLESAGLTVVTEGGRLPDFVLKVAYREERGREIRFDLYGTVITCHVLLERADGARLLDFTIQEFPPDGPFVTAPYTDVIHQLETNPYFYFLGEVVQARVSADQDVTGGLIAGLARLTQHREPLYGSMVGPPPNPGDTLPPAEDLYVREVRFNTMRELARVNDRRAIPLMTALLEHPESRVRRNAIHALATMGVRDAREKLERLAEQDTDDTVREAAKTALSRL